jgi:cell fate regulator YaaT (PSP1 superfamily)
VPHLVEIAFKGNRKEFFQWEGEEPPPLKAAVIVSADRGEDLGRVHAIGELAAKRCQGCAHGCGTEPPPRKALRLASSDERKRGDELRAQDEDARRRSMERVRAHALPMKVSDAEWQWDRRKLTLFFTAEKRVDFRALVRDLAAMFRTRIELKQIGVRDEAKRLDGVGRCGRQYCSASWLPELRPVNLGVAKDQHLSLNPSQISGACGRLMCCLRYEHEFYVQSRKKFPKEGKTVTTTRGEERVVANDIFGERVTLRGVDGETRVLPLADFTLELGGVEVAEPPRVETPEPDQPVEQEDEFEGVPMSTAEYSIDPVAIATAPTPEAPPATPPAPRDAAPAVPRDTAPAAPRDAAPAEPTGAEGATPADDADSNRPRRRRGRRGGRRGRGGSGGGQNRGGGGEGGNGSSGGASPPPPGDGE